MTVSLRELPAQARRPIFATGTLTSAGRESCVDDFCAGVCSEPQLSHPPQAPCALPADATASHRAIRPSPRNTGARASSRLETASRRCRRLRGPSDDTAYPALTRSARPTRELSRMLFMRTHQLSALAIVYVIHDPT